MVSLEEALKYNKKQIAVYLEKPYETVKRWPKDKLRQAVISRNADLKAVEEEDEEVRKAKLSKKISLDVLKKIEDLIPSFGCGEDGLNSAEAKILTLFLEQEHKIQLEAIKARIKAKIEGKK